MEENWFMYTLKFIILSVSEPVPSSPETYLETLLLLKFVFCSSGKSVRSAGTNMTNASGMSTVKSKNTMKAGLAVETMSAPNPFCPNTKGVCCLMVLTNLSLILICIGFIIVLQLTDPPVVWSVHSDNDM